MRDMTRPADEPVAAEIHVLAVGDAGVYGQPVPLHFAESAQGLGRAGCNAPPSRPLGHTCAMAPRVMISGDPVPTAAGGRLRHPGTARKQIWHGSGDCLSEDSPWLGAGSTGGAHSSRFDRQ
jgi:hypothetical protein